MSDAARQEQQVVEMADFLRETISEIDAGIQEMTARRNGLAVRLAAIEAAMDPAVLAAEADYETRRDDGRPYDDAEDSTKLIEELHRRFGRD